MTDIDLRGEGPVKMPADLISPLFGWISDAFWHVHGLRIETQGQVYFRDFSAMSAAMRAILDARDAVRDERLRDNERFERLLAAEAMRQRNVRIEAELKPENCPDCDRNIDDCRCLPDPDLLYDAWRDQQDGL